MIDEKARGCQETEQFLEALISSVENREKVMPGQRNFELPMHLVQACLQATQA